MRSYVSLVLVGCILVLVSISFSQTASVTSVPNLIRYSGALKDSDGAPLASTTVGVTFAIYKQQEGGATIWMETQNIRTDDAGSYTVLLGITTPAGLPTDLFSPSEQRWLGVQVQTEPELPRVLLVSVPYALRAHDADTLGGRRAADFMLAGGMNGSNGTSATLGGRDINQLAFGTSSATTDNQTKIGAENDGPTNFGGSTTDQIVGVTQTGTGAGLVAFASSDAVLGSATGSGGHAVEGQALGANGVGVDGETSGNAGIGVVGNATSTSGNSTGVMASVGSDSGVGVHATATASSGSTFGLQAYVSSPEGTAGYFNGVGGTLLAGVSNGEQRFAVDGGGNVNASGTFSGSGAGLTGIQFSQLSGTLGGTQLSGNYSDAVSLSNSGNSFSGNGAGLTGVSFSQLLGTLGSAQLSGTYNSPITLSSKSNVFYGNGANLTGVISAPGSPYYIQNGTSLQSANFNISGNGTVAGYITSQLASANCDDESAGCSTRVQETRLRAASR